MTPAQASMYYQDVTRDHKQTIKAILTTATTTGRKDPRFPGKLMRTFKNMAEYNDWKAGRTP